MSREIKRSGLLAILLLLLLLPCRTMAEPPQNRAPAGDELNKGVSSYRLQRYDEAIQHFRNSIARDPNPLYAHLYLATTYAKIYIPGNDGPENLSRAENAITEYKAVLDRDPQNIDSMKGVAWLYLNMKQYEQARRYYERAANIDSQDPETYYSIGFIDWTQAYQLRMELRSQSGLATTDSAIDLPICPAIRAQNWERVQHGIGMLEKAIKLRPDYDDAMAYQNLMYRERADMRCGDHPASEADQRQADEWMDKTITIKSSKANAGKSENNQQ